MRLAESSQVKSVSNINARGRDMNGALWADTTIQINVVYQTRNTKWSKLHEVGSKLRAWKQIMTSVLGTYDVELIRCFPQYDVKLMWRHRGNNIVSVAAICVAAICTAAQLIFLFGRTRLAVWLACVLGRWAVFRINSYYITCNCWCTTGHFRCRWRLKCR